MEGPHAAMSSEPGQTVAEALYGDDHEAPDVGYEGLVRARPGDPVADPAELIRAWIGRPSWHRRAACRGVDTTVFFPVLGGNYARARAVCARCPTAGPCLAGALALDPADDDGFRGGLTARERRELRRDPAAA
ncbi:MAG: WhiB family transcriptional regulator [Acidimicrobiales bacterium]